MIVPATIKPVTAGAERPVTVRKRKRSLAETTLRFAKYVPVGTKDFLLLRIKI